MNRGLKDMNGIDSQGREDLREELKEKIPRSVDSIVIEETIIARRIRSAKDKKGGEA